jgi:hypothetical protein
MKNWSTSQRITWSFGVVIALMVVMGAFAYSRLMTIEELNRVSLGLRNGILRLKLA